MADEKGASGTAGAPASPPPERSLKLKIAKKAYVFDVRKKYAATRSFAVKKAPETPAEGIKDSIQAMLRGGKKPAPQSAQGDAAAQAKKEGEAPSPAKKQPSTLSTVIKIAAAVIALFVLSVVWIFVQYGGTGGAAPPALPGGFSGSYEMSIGQSNVLSVGQMPDPARSAYFLLGLSSQNLTQANFSAALFREKPLTQVFVLDHVRESADSYPAFYSLFSSRLAALGIAVNRIGLESLPSLPEGALLIVPTGYFPKEMLIEGGSNFKSLLARGVDIVYIGMPFDTLALDSSGSTVKSTITDVAFSKSRPDSNDGFLLFDAQYTASPGKSGAGYGMVSENMLYGSVSVLRVGKGNMMFLPQFLDGGWQTDADSQGFEKAASDISRLILEERWLAPIATASASLEAPKEKETVSLYTTPFSQDAAYVRLTMAALDQNGVVSRTFVVTEVEKGQKGEMTPREAQTVPFYLSGQKTRINLALKESDPAPVKLFVAMYKDGLELQRSEFELGLTNPTIEKSVDFQVNAEPGTYVLMVVDGAGKVYAATELTVIDLDIAMTYANWPLGAFNFTLSAQGRPVSPSSMSVALDGAGERQYGLSSLSRTPSSTLLSYSYAGKISPGGHKFTFSAGGWSKDFEAEYFVRKNFWENPTVIILAVVSLLVFGLGTMLRRPEVLKYGLDIPDFPPLSTIKIPVKRETVLEIFDNVNAGYSWKWMPLRAEELKSGFRKLTYNGKPILIGDFNLERVLSRLREEGQVKDELDYWGKAEWEKQSGHSIRYLMIYRVLRNVFVNNAVKFSKLDAIPECDVKAVVGNEEIYLHIMEEPRERVVHRALATVTRGHTIIVFKTKEEVEDFSRALNSPSKLAVALKMEVNSKNILLLPVKEAITAYLKGKAV